MGNFKSNLLKVLIIISLIVGIGCRFYDLNGKALSNDETFSATYILGINNKSSWIIYSLSVAWGLYSNLLFGFVAIASEINKNSNSVVIFEDLGDALTMSYLLDGNVKVHLTRKVSFFIQEDKGKIYQNFNNTFLFRPDDKTAKAITKDPNLKAELISISDTFLLHKPQVWRIEI